MRSRDHSFYSNNNKLIGQIKKIYYSNLAVEKVSKIDNVVHGPLLNIAGISLFYTTQIAKVC